MSILGQVCHIDFINKNIAKLSNTKKTMSMTWYNLVIDVRFLIKEKVKHNV